jgi:predicted transcriptional regulator
MTRIVIHSVERPGSNNMQEIIRWFCMEFGFSNGLDDDNIAERLLEQLAEAAREKKGLTSSELKVNKDLARSTIIYHLNRFIDSGLVVKIGRQYYLRATQLARAIEEIQYDIDREMKKMTDTAKEFDRLMSTRLKSTNR